METKEAGVTYDIKLKQCRNKICKFLKIRFRSKEEMFEAYRWFFWIMMAVIWFQLIALELKVLFHMVYTNGHFTFSMMWINIGFEALNGVLYFTSAYAFGELFCGILESTDQSL